MIKLRARRGSRAARRRAEASRARPWPAKSLPPEAQALQAALDLARIRSWTVDLQNGALVLGPGEDHVFGQATGALHLNDLFASVHPDDREAVLAVWADLAPGSLVDLKYRVITSGELQWLHVRAHVYPEADGTARSMVGIAQDITEQKQAEELIAAQRDLARVISAASDEEAWPICLDVALRVSGLDSGGIYRFDEARRILDLVYHQGLSAEFVRGAASYTEDSPNVDLINAGQAIYLSVEDINLTSLSMHQAEGLRAIAVIPVHHQGSLLGCINLSSHSLGAVPAFARRALETIAPEIGSVMVYRHTAAALRESQQRLQMTISGANVGTWDWYVQSGTIIFNERWANLLGYRLDELAPTSTATWNELCHPEDLQRSNALQERHFAGETPLYECETRMRHRDGHWVWGIDRGQVIERDADGRPARMSGTYIDISARKAAEQELLELNRTLEERVRQRSAEVQDLYEHAPIGYHSLDVQGRLIRANQTFLSWLGYTRDELFGRPLTDVLTPESAQAFTGAFADFREHGYVRDLEFDMLRKDGSVFPVLIGSTVVYDERGEYLMSRTSVFDNTERRWAEVAMRESEAQTRLLFEESPDAVILLDEQGQVVRLNRAFEQLTGYEYAPLAGRSLEQLGLITPEQGAALIRAGSEASRHGPVAVELRLRRAGGEVYEVGARVFGLNLQGRRHYLTTMRDITTEKRVEETLRRANLELARAARAKDEFLANMSHELRTPLNAILAFSESLIEQIRGPLNQRQLDSLRNIESSGRHLLALINDILDLSKVEAGRLDLHHEPVSLVEICEASLLFVKEQAARKSLSLESALSGPASVIEADPKRLKQILVNLLSNAVKFTPAGGSVRLEVDTDPAAGMLRLIVEDTGIGIAPEDQAWLFQPFKQLDSSLSRQHEGTGLGLALVRRLVELHAGEITVASEPGRGSRFTVLLPLRTFEPMARPAPQGDAPQAPPDEPRAAHPSGARILVAEDNEINIMAISDYLEVRGYAVVVARNGIEALAQAEQTRPDLILMDIQMPELDGLEATRRLRARPEHAATPIIALTALAMPGDRERCLAAGASAYVTKPVSLRALADVIAHLLHARPV